MDRERVWLHAIPADSNENAQDQNAWGGLPPLPGRDPGCHLVWPGLHPLLLRREPHAGRLFGGQRWFRTIWKPRLDGMVRRLNGQGVADTPYQDRPW